MNLCTQETNSNLSLGADFQFLPQAFPSSPWLGSYRAEIADFFVAENLSFAPSGKGEQVFLNLEKTNISTGFLIEQVARAAKVPSRSLGFSGLKDRFAQTRQWLSLAWPLNQSVEDLEQQLQLAAKASGQWRLLEIKRHERKLKRGSHKSNFFRLRLKISSLTEASNLENAQTWLAERWHLICTQGVPNYFGPQRFGVQAANLQQALHQLGSTTNNRRRNNKTNMQISALRSALFNLHLADLLTTSSWLNPSPERVYNLAGSKSFFSDAQAENLAQRVASLDVHPAAPLAGTGNFKSTGKALLQEQNLRAQQLPAWEYLESQGLNLEYRSLRLVPTQAQFSWQEPWLELSFNLPTGCFATSVLRELVQPEDVQLQKSSLDTHRKV